ncbi:MFS transporter [Methanomassiliicoccus luminyensis]|uniref:MFS transporter n=1 Tax=Methanomassiliicoccus luminyensis TaxID=1080712 RepID=UPI0023513BAE|nr:MFS transporter [Methanomassiliicoccus luminyensis]
MFSGRIISATGYSIVMPFLAIYLNGELDVGMGAVGLLFLGMALTGALGQIVGGELSDRVGRRPMLWLPMGLRGLVFLSLFIAMALSGNIWLTSGLILCSSFLGTLFEPASNAMIADIVEPGRRMEGYSILRVGQNAGWTLGPIISGMMLTVLPFHWLFVVAGLSNIAAGAVVFLMIAEPQRSVQGDRFRVSDLLRLGRNSLFIVLCLASIPLFIVLGQLTSTFAVFSSQDLQVDVATVGWLYALNGIMVVFLQMPMARYIARFRMPYVLAAGAMMYAAGYLVMGWASGIWFLVAAIVITSLGENTVSPSAMNMVADLSPEKERGRYMGAYGIFSTFGWSMGPAVGGVLYDLFHLDPVVLWGCIAAIAMIGALGFVYLGRLAAGSHDRAPGPSARKAG